MMARRWALRCLLLSKTKFIDDTVSNDRPVLSRAIICAPAVTSCTGVTHRHTAQGSRPWEVRVEERDERHDALYPKYSPACGRRH